MIILLILPLGAWLQHIHATATAGHWLRLVVGAVVFPLGMLNGAAIWLGLAP